ncbi:hypothetical protein [Streptomyces sp. BHT-5-2]|uniref:hypothetical protein n=1 Tax=Streptomyces sp. BHT-5-2 TaxID=2866715 RepID=UPI0021B14146|nr:hypothetical protein [Streptomyces sp. BHT-5-2]
MTDTQLLPPARELGRYLTGLGRLLDPAAGWYGVFARRDPEGLRACLEGREVPPWDVVESLLRDLAARHGERAVRDAEPRARLLHARAVADHDARPGSRPALRERLELMLREQQRAARRARELEAVARTAAGPPEGAQLSRELAWARDDLARAQARVRELRARLAALPDRPGPGVDPAAGVPGPPAEMRPGAPGEAVPHLSVEAGPEPPAEAVPGLPVEADPEAPAAAVRPRAGARTARPRGARFAGLELSDGPSYADPVTVEPPTARPAAAPRPAPRGARFAGAYAAPDAESGAPDDAPPADPGPAPEARRVATATAHRLARLRATGATGPAHAELCAAATRPAPELPLLLAALEDVGLASDVPVLLWEAAGLPPAGLAAAADALAAAGRSADGTTLLRQSVARPVAEVAATALALLDLGRPGQAGELLAGVARSRTPDEAAALAAADPGALGPLLLAAARAVSRDRHRDLAHALRAAGLTAAP